MKLGLQDIRFFERTSSLDKSRRFLDVGCATGMLLEYMREKGWNVQGVELCRESAEYGMRRRNIDIFVGTLEQAGFPDSSFPVIHFSHLIEHVPDPKTFFLEIRRILVPGGYVVVVTPNIDGLQARLFRESWRSAIADHLTLFSKSTLAAMLAATGFQVLQTVTWGGLAKGSVPAAVKRPVDFLAKRLGFGDVVLMLARKPGNRIPS
jgi:2-polyprenyl-3-methyl-5-hydroxy-6-metoxy-1,4-benzoquinol methylase